MDEQRTLKDTGIVLEGSGWPHGDVVVRDMFARCHASEVLHVISELIEHVRTMSIASRFREDSYAYKLTTDDELHPPLELIDVHFGSGGKLSEVGHKRAMLLKGLQGIRLDLLLLFQRLMSLRLDVEATNMEDDGSHVPKPSPEALERRNYWDPKPT